MDIKDLKGLMEAYQQVNAPEQLDEMDVKLKTPEERAKYIEDAKKREERKKQPSIFDYARKRKEEGRPLKIDLSRAVAAQNKKEAEKRAALKNEELDIFDVVLEFLQAEGYAETLEEAEWMMANLLDKETIDIIVEAMHEDEDEEDEKEMKKGKKNKKEDEEEDEEEDDELSEASYSAKAARAGKDIGKPGKAFAKIAKSAAKRYGSKERGEKVAGAVLAKLRAKRG